MTLKIYYVDDILTLVQKILSIYHRATAMTYQKR